MQFPRRLFCTGQPVSGTPRSEGRGAFVHTDDAITQMN